MRELGVAAVSPSLLGSRAVKFVRGRGDMLRRAYAIGQRATHLRSYLVRRRAALAVRPAPGITVARGEGFRVFPAGTFGEADETAHAAVALFDRSEQVLQTRRRTRVGKQFMVNLLQPSDITNAHPLFRLATRRDVLDAVVDYLGTVPVLRTLQIFYSGAVDRSPVSSQLLHCDADDVSQLKLFVLCTDVTLANGPLTLLDADTSERVRRATRYRYRERLLDGRVAPIVGQRQPIELVGGPGTSCLVDTSRCFHYGSRVAPGAAPRVMAMAQYVSPLAFIFAGATGALPLAHLSEDGMTPIQRAVLTGRHHGL